MWLCNKKHYTWKKLLPGTCQNLDFLKINKYRTTMEFLDINLSSRLVPTIMQPTQITKNNATFSHDIYLFKELSKHYHLYILLNDISDHFPCIVLLSNVHRKTWCPLIFKTYKMTDSHINEIWNILCVKTESPCILWIQTKAWIFSITDYLRY